MCDQLFLEIDPPQWPVINIIKRPIEIDVKYTFEISTHPQTVQPGQVFSYI